MSSSYPAYQPQPQHAAQYMAQPPLPAATRARAASGTDDGDAGEIVVEVEGTWSLSHEGLRHEGCLLDATIHTRDGDVQSHKSVLAAHSSFARGLFTSGSRMANNGGSTVSLLDFDAHTIQVIVDCFYNGRLSLSDMTACRVLEAANMLGVPAIEKTAGRFFIG
eukprot:COSAG01_NODE_16611_length_1221_cov_1.219251_1_plen_163_part_10